MANEFRITFQTDIDESGALKEVDKLIDQIKKEPIKLNIEGVDKVQSSLDNVAKLLEKVQSTSKKGGTKIETGAEEETKELNELINSYNKYLNMQRAIQRQMSKTSNPQSYRVLEKELESVNKEISKTAQRLDEAGKELDEFGKKTITNSLANTFQSVNKQIDTTISQIDKLLKTGKISEGQFKSLTTLKNDIQSLKTSSDFKLENILDTAKPYERMSELVTLTQYFKNNLRSLKIDINFSQKTDKGIKSIDTLIGKLKTLSQSGFSNNRSIDDLVKKLEQAKTQMQQLDPNTEGAKAEFDALTTTISACEERYKELKAQVSNFKGQFNLGTDLNKALGEITQLKKGFAELGQSSSELDRIENELRQLSTIDQDLAVASLRRLKTEIAQVKTDLGKMTADHNSAQKLQQTYEKTFNSISSKVQKVGYDIKNAFNNQFMDMGQLRSLETRFKGLQNLIKNIDLSKLDGKQLANLEQKLAEITSKMQSLNQTAKQTKLENKFNIDCSKAITQLQKLKEQYVLLGKDSSGIDTMIDKVNQLQSEVGQTDLGKLRQELVKVNQQSAQIKNKLGGVGGMMKTTFSQIASSFSMYAPGYIIGNTVVRGISDMKNEILELDKAMTNFKKVADETYWNTQEKLDGITKNAMAIANETASSLTEVVESMAEASKLGMGQYGLKAIEDVSKYAQIFANVGDINVNEATEGIAVLLNAFDLEPLKKYEMQVNGVKKETTELAHAMDLLNYAGNNYSIGVDGLLTAISSGGNVLGSFGISIEETTALITSANESIQDTSRVGNGLKSIASNLAGLTTSAKDGTIQTNKTAKSLKEIAGIDIFTDKNKNKVKTMTQMMDELSVKWKDLDDDEQKALGNAIAGKQQMVVFQSLMQNYDTYKKMMTEFNNGEDFNSAVKENAKYIDSIEGRMQKLKNTWTEIATTVFTSDSIKSFVDGLGLASEPILDLVKSLSELNIALPITLGMFVGLVKIIRATAYAKSLSGGLALLGMQLTETGGAWLNFITRTEGAVLPISKVTLAIGGLIAGYIAFKKIAELIDKNNTKHTRNWDTLKKKIKDTQKTILDYKDKENTLDGLYDKYKKLAKVTNKTEKQQKEYNKVLEELAKIDPDLVIYDEDGSPIKARKGEVEDLIREYQRAIREQEKLLQGDLKQKAKESYGKYEEKSIDRNKMTNELEQYRRDLLEKENKATGIWESKLQDDWFAKVQKGDKKAIESAQEYFNNLKLVKDKEKETIDEITSQRESINSDQYAWLENLFGSNEDLENAGEDRKKAIENVLKLDYSQFDGDKMESISDRLNDWLSGAKYKDTGKFNKYIDQVNELNKQWEKGKITSDEYKDSVNDIARDLVDLMDGKFTASELGMMLKIAGFDVTIENEVFDDVEDAQNTLNEKLFNMELESPKQRLKLAYELIQDDRVPAKVKDKISELAKDGEISEQDLQILMELVANLDDEDLKETVNEKIDKLSEEEEITKEVIIKYAKKVKDGTDLGEFIAELTGSDDLSIDIQTHASTGDLKQLKADLEGLKTSEKIGIMVAIANSGNYDVTELAEILSVLPEEQRVEVINEIKESGKYNVEELNNAITELKKNKEIEIAIDTKNTNIEYIKDLLDDLGVSHKLQLKLESAIKKGDLGEIMSLLKDLPEEQQVAIYTSIINNGEYKVDEIGKIISKLPKEQRVSVLTSVIQNGNYNITEVSGLIDDLPEEQRIDIVTTLINSDNYSLEQMRTLVELIPEEKRVEVLTSIADSLEKLGTVEAYQLRTKILQILGDNNDAMNKANQTQKKTQSIPNKTVKINADDNATPTIEDIRDEARTPIIQKVKISVTETVNKVTKYFSKYGGGGHYAEYGGGFSNISDAPTDQVSADSTGFSNISSTPTGASEGSATPTATPTASSGGEVSAKSVGSFGSVLTSKTEPTYILKSYKNIIAMVKYGVNIFQELENRIARTNNQLDLLGIKMERAVGQKKIDYLKTQNTLYKEQAKLQKVLWDKAKAEKSDVKYSLKKSGFKFDEQGNLKNYEEKILALEKSLANAEKKRDAYTGKSEKKKKSLDKSVEQATKKLEDAKKLTEEYMTLQYETIPNAEQEWYNLQNAIKSNNDELETLKLNLKNLPSVNKILDNDYKKADIQSYLNRNEVDIDNKVGIQKIKALEKQNALISQQIQLNKENIKAYKTQKSNVRNKLDDYGFKFDEYGLITNLDERLNKYKNSESYDKIKGWVEEYTSLNQAQDDLRDENKQLNDQIKETGYLIKSLKLDEAMKPYNNSLESAERNIKKLNNELDILSLKFEHAHGKEKLNLIKEQIKLNKQLKEEEESRLNTLKAKERPLKQELSSQGFKFDSFGNITNISSILNSIKDSDAKEYVESLLEQWEQLHNEDIPEAEKSVLSYDNAVKDAYEEQLQITTEIEDKITDMIEDQLEKRKEAIEKQSEAVVKALEKERQAYKDMRAEVDYQDDYKEKVDEISKISKELETARKDTSLTNRKKIKDLEKQLEDAQKELEDFVQDKIDSDVDKAYEDKINSIEEESEKQVEQLEEQWTESKIAQAVREALDTGVFTDLDGNIRDLEDAMLEFAQKSADHFSVMGQSIENDLIDNLNIALDTLDNLSSIMNELDLSDIKTYPTVGEQPSTKNLTVSGISINVSTIQGADPDELAKEIQKGIENALNGVIEGL